jgi:hypothetical protein
MAHAIGKPVADDHDEGALEELALDDAGKRCAAWSGSIS